MTSESNLIVMAQLQSYISLSSSDTHHSEHNIKIEGGIDGDAVLNYPELHIKDELIDESSSNEHQNESTDSFVIRRRSEHDEDLFDDYYKAIEGGEGLVYFNDTNNVEEEILWSVKDKTIEQIDQNAGATEHNYCCRWHNDAASKTQQPKLAPSVNRKQKHQAGTEKPPYSYAQLITQAIGSTETGRLSLADIYVHIMRMYPYYNRMDRKWQNSIRHNLSLNKSFVKVPREDHQPSKGSLWMLDTRYEESLLSRPYVCREITCTGGSSSSSATSATPSRSASLKHATTKTRRPRKKSNLNNASTREARRKRIKRAQLLPEQIETRNAAQRIRTAESRAQKSQEQRDERIQENIIRTRAAGEQEQ